MFIYDHKTWLQRMASKEADDLRVDVMHVATYLPLIMLLLRAAIFLTAMQVMTILVGHIHLVFAVSAWFVYFDASLFKNDASNRMCGFLVPVALMYGINRLIDIQFLSNATQNFNCNISSATFISHYVLAVTWATTSIFMLIYVFVEIPHPKLDLQLLSFFSGALGIAMLWTECLTKPFPELLLRGMMFYIFTFAFFLLHAYAQHLHCRRYTTIGMHISLHLLFVNLYIVAGSVMLCMALIFYLVRKSRALNQHSDDSAVNQTNVTSNTSTFKHKNPTQTKIEEMNYNEACFPGKQKEEDALHELMLAKRAINMV